jgi:HTH-type transcriptional regulator/antitoxin HigA
VAGRRLTRTFVDSGVLNAAEHERLLGILSAIEHKAAEQDISPEEERLSDLLFALIESYEDEKYKNERPTVTPLEHVKLFMQDRRLAHKDVWRLFGSRGITSEVLNGKRQISRTHAHKPAEFFEVGVEFFV